MLEELKNKFYSGSKNDLIFFLSDILGKRVLSISGIKKARAYSPDVPASNIDALVVISHSLKFIEKKEGKISLHVDLMALSKQELCELVYKKILNEFVKIVNKPNLFQYDHMLQMYKLNHHLIPLAISILRDMIVNLSIFSIRRDEGKTEYFLSRDYEKLLEQKDTKTPRKMSLQQLLTKLDNQAIIGESAEFFVVEYEKTRLEGRIPKRISEFDVGAGYDILSYESVDSESFDRFIEVKAVGENFSFHWSVNEKNKAKLYGDKYFLYLVDLKKAKTIINYSPKIIKNPAVEINLPNWSEEAESFVVKYLH